MMVRVRVKISRILLVLFFSTTICLVLYCTELLLFVNQNYFAPSEVSNLNEKFINKYYYVREQMRSAGDSGGDDDEACRIPIPAVIPPYFIRHWKPSAYARSCKHFDNLMSVVEDKISPRNLHTDGCTRFGTIPMCAQEVVFRLSECKPVWDGQSIGSMETFFTVCGKRLQAEAIIPINKRNVQAKLDYWKRIEPELRPPAVFLFGFDTVSRAQAYRSLPKSLELMLEKLDFVDFSAYHSVAPLTMTNFMAFLMGMTRSQVRLSCAPNWTFPYDDCPLIWNKFSAQHYITSYLEDDDQSLNWGGQSGFKQVPTDYYIHHLFMALSEARGIPSDWMLRYFNVKERDCTSKKTVPEFMLKYTIDFLHKFADVPFFNFLWFAYPFHNNLFALPNFDNSFSQLFKMLEGNRDLLENVIFIFLSDHGDRTKFFGERSPESYFERGLPPLFVRLPEKLKRRFPHFQNTLKLNSHKLTTPFDIHETLLHILSGKATYTNPRAPDRRSSILAPFPPGRTCRNTNIPEGHCLCDLGVQEGELNSPRLDEHKSLLLEECVRYLNQMISRSKYSQVCSSWKSLTKNVGYVAPISAVKYSTEALLVFVASPGGAKFEARLRIRFKDEANSKVSSVKVVGLVRTTDYEDESWCVQETTDEDKKMKEFCFCKQQRQS